MMIWPNIEPRLPCGAVVESVDDGRIGQVTGWEGYDDEAYVRWLSDGSTSLVPAGDLIPVIQLGALPPCTPSARKRG